MSRPKKSKDQDTDVTTEEEQGQRTVMAIAVVFFHQHARVPVSHAFVLKENPDSKNAQVPL